jgi:hypothetical protein
MDSYDSYYSEDEAEIIDYEFPGDTGTRKGSICVPSSKYNSIVNPGTALRKHHFPIIKVPYSE